MASYNGDVEAVGQISDDEPAAEVHFFPLESEGLTLEGSASVFGTYSLSVSETGEMTSAAAAPSIIYELIENALEAEAGATGYRDIAGQISTAGLVGSDFVVSANYHVSAESLAYIINGIQFLNDFWDGWAYNLKTGAASMYEDFKFNSFLRVGNEYYGLNDDGLHLLGADDDAGEEIKAIFTTGRSDYGVNYTKKIPAIYAGAKTDKPLLMTVRVDGKPAYTYAFQSAPGELSRCRVKLGRGLEGAYWQLEVSNQDGADFDLDSIDIQLEPNHRKI
jgi:hypothetical protein